MGLIGRASTLLRTDSGGEYVCTRCGRHCVRQYFVCPGCGSYDVRREEWER